MNDELERIWKEAVMAYCKVLSQQIYEETEENQEKPQVIIDSLCVKI
jgi:hypothetical protein